jgi:hypothetical protein
MENSNWLTAKHPTYNKHISDVLFYKSCYLDTKAFIENNLPKFFLEFQKDYETRKQRAIHLNLFATIVNQPIKAIFSDKLQIKREFKRKYKPLKDYINNINGNGQHINKLMATLTTRALAAKQSYAYIKTLDNGNQAVVPYWFDSITNWATDENNRYLWLMIQSQKYSHTDPKLKPVEQNIITLFTRQGWEQYDVERKSLIDSGELKISLIPFIRIAITDEDDDGIGEGWGKKLVKFDKEILNTLSLYQIELYRNLFNVLTMQISSSDKVKGFVKVLSESNILGYEKDHSPPQYLSPNIQTLQEKKQHLTWCIEMARYISGFKAKDDVEYNQPQSGIAKLLDIHNTSETIANISKAIEIAEKQIFYYLAIYENIIQPDYDFSQFCNEITIAYPVDFSRLDLDKEFSRIMEGLNASFTNEELNLQLEKLAAEILLHNYLPEKELKTVLDYYTTQEAKQIKIEKDKQTVSQEGQALQEINQGAQ